ncbi:unnamed protein product [Pedinophyceae sp. YPF-701]|nr:unnamed protein product [Pedinophyceae sp. YPF-701]
MGLLRRALARAVFLAVVVFYVVPYSCLILARVLWWFFTNPTTCFYTKDRTGAPDVAVPPFADKTFIEHDDIKLHVVHRKPGAGTRNMRSPSAPKPKLLLMVHGFPEFWYSWRHQFKALAPHFHVAAMDMRGYNLSGKPRLVSDYDAEKLASDIPAVVRGLGYDTCILVGHDWGGAVGWLVCHLHPEVVEKYICLCGPHPRMFQRNMTLGQALRSSYIMAFQPPLIAEAWMSAFDFRGVASAFTKPPFGAVQPGAITREDVERYKVAISRPGALTATLNYYRAAFRRMGSGDPPETRQAMRRRLRMPVLVMAGARDAALGTECYRNMEEVCEDVRVEIVDDASHWLQQDQPDLVSRRILEFAGGGAAE